VNFLVLFLFPVHTWFLQSIDYSSFTRKFSCPLPVPCSHFNFIVIFPVHTSVYHPFLVPHSQVNLLILFLFPVHTLILSSFGCSLFKCESSQLFLVPCSHVNMTIFYFLLPVHTSLFQSFSSSPGHMWNFQSFPNHQGNFVFYQFLVPIMFTKTIS
jgi:hypothetical protein